ncbi:Crp/Fnr family transcriptional regulator [Aquabacterium humicola]|uniref:Crp/Fnr family transcriptional regulator n=1 Tax=Aquabacterium humicola TaxID=3237377 RepID=UPI002543108D|nr:Crp/Fnr family transcriptional regulator [Rubrivivax pictus]
MTMTADVQGNRLLAALPQADRERWLARLEPVMLRRDQVLYDAGVAPSHAYFPTTAIVSLMYIEADGASTETAVVGREGLVGAALLLGGESTCGRAVVRRAGEGFRIGAQAISEEFTRSADVTRLLLRGLQAQITQTAQTSVCNRHHTIGQQLCRCLLMTHDRSVSDTLDLTQETLGTLIGVRRESVTQAALQLQDAGLIRYGRGHIRILDRAGLERAACECYEVVRREYDRLLPPPRRAPAPPTDTMAAEPRRARGRVHA